VVHPLGVANEIPCSVEVKVPDSGGTVASGSGVGVGSGVGLDSGGADGDALWVGVPPTAGDDERGLISHTPTAPTAITTTAAAASFA
jgi:hypothetical protein